MSFDAPVARFDLTEVGDICSSPRAVFAECPHCGSALSPEHAHYRCQQCGWRDSCCD
ncbi:MAG TPA: hypothetical protein VND89_12530 [Acidimicrobiales bacterium]|nr:hypothetical protein [Acidimicrobiales bacterium]